MIHLLTGEFGSGKTSWLLQMVDHAFAKDIPLAGVISPALFEDGHKTGIDCLLLPSRECMHLATRRDLVKPPQKEDPVPLERNTTSMDPHPANGGLSRWVFTPETITRINRYCESLYSRAFSPAREPLLIVDEVGPLELLQNSGFREAMRLLDENIYHHAVIVVRPSLIESARERWGTLRVFTPERDVSDFLETLDFPLCGKP